MSFGSTVVNGQTQPAHPVRMSWVNVWFPPKAGEKGIGGFASGWDGPTSDAGVRAEHLLKLRLSTVIRQSASTAYSDRSPALCPASSRVVETHALHKVIDRSERPSPTEE